MKEEEIKELFEQFEAIANEYEGVECWSARELAETEKRLSGVLYERGVDSKGFAIIRSLGDKASPTNAISTSEKGLWIPLTLEPKSITLLI